MKKLFTASLAVLASMSVYADSVTIINAGEGVPGRDIPQLMGLSISPNGRYVCGALEWGAGIYVADVQTKEVKWSLCGEQGGELRHVDNNGKAIGFTDVGVTYSFDNPEETIITATNPDSKYYMGEALTNDGSLYVGSLVKDAFITQAAITTGSGEAKILPVPTGDELGGLKIGEGSAAKYVSADGKVIAGFLGSFAIPIVWTQNAEGEYEFDFFAPRILNSEVGIGHLTSISAMYFNLSNNGKYLCMVGLVTNDETGALYNIPVVYNIETKEATYYTETQSIDEDGVGLYPSAIANDGTFIGCVGQPYFASSGSFIMKAGETQARLFRKAFPTYNYFLGEADSLGFDIPTGISADGRYLQGYTFTSDNYYDDDSPAYYTTYVIDTLGDSGVEVIDIDPKELSPEAIYDVNGLRKHEMTKGINIIKMNDGSVRKVFNR